jgi:DNA-binding NarL/FixJ family response regulator/GAF domain-containing protein
MEQVLVCPHCGKPHPAFLTLSDALLGIARETSVDAVLRNLVEAARRLTNARYAALGVPDGEGGFAQFYTTGIDDELYRKLGPLPRTHGVLGAMLAETTPTRLPDISADPRFQYWPPHHPHMRSMLSVPVLTQSRSRKQADACDVIAAFYITDKEDAPEFSLADQQLIELLAAHAAITIENARLYEASRELIVAEERNRLARDLHDSVTQQLFSIALTAEAALSQFDSDPVAARKHLEDVSAQTRAASQEMRSLIFELRPAELERDGLVTTLRKHVEVLARARGRSISFDAAGDRPLPFVVESEAYFVAQEALNNALNHAGATTINVDLQIERAKLILRVRDDGEGFDVEEASRPDFDGRTGQLDSRHSQHRLDAGHRYDRDDGGASGMSESDRVRIVIADDHPVVRQGLRAFLETQPEVEILGEASDGEEAVRQVERLLPDVVLMDVVMPKLDGIEAIRRIRAISPSTQAIVLTSFADDDKIVAAVRAGAAGYLLKDARPQELTGAIRAVARGEALLAPSVAARLMRELSRPNEDSAASILTSRELDVLRLIASGRSNKEIAIDLVLSEKTVKTHVSNILAKLHLADRTQAALYAVRQHLVDPSAQA